MKISPTMDLSHLIDCMSPNGDEAVTEAQAAAMRELINRDAPTYGWKSTGDIEDTDWHRMNAEATEGKKP